MKKLHTSRYYFLDIVRIIAMGMIVWFHIALTLLLPGNDGLVIPKFYYFSLGNIGVSIFIILSGLVLQLRYAGAPLELYSFFKSRIVKIYLVYFVSFLFLLLIRIFKNISYVETVWYSCPECTLVRSACSVAGICAFFGEWGGPFGRTSWFIGVILCLYLLYPKLKQWLARSPTQILFFTLIVSVISRLFITKLPFLTGTPLEWFPLNRIFEFTLGMYLAPYFQKSSFASLSFTKTTGNFISLLSALTFPVFLLHYEFDFLLIQMRLAGYSYLKTITLYLIISLVVSYLCLVVVNVFEKKQKKRPIN